MWRSWRPRRSNGWTGYFAININSLGIFAESILVFFKCPHLLPPHPHLLLGPLKLNKCIWHLLDHYTVISWQPQITVYGLLLALRLKRLTISLMVGNSVSTELDTKSEECQRFFRDGLTTSFHKILNDEAVNGWKYEIHVSWSCWMRCINS